MTIASELQALQTNLDNSYTAVNNKGGTMPASQNFDNLATAISSIPAAVSPVLITKNITSNGTYNASSDNADGYSSVIVNVSGGGSSTKYGLSLDELLGDTNANGVLQAPVGDINLVFTGVQDIANYALPYRFYYNNKVKTVSFPNLTNISGDESMSECFRYNTALVSLSFESLVTISAFAALRYVCASDSALSVISFPELTTISGRQSLYHAFDSNTALVSISFPKLKYVTGGEAFNGAFESDSNLENVSFDLLEQIGDNSNNTNNKGHFANAFRSTKVKNITFPKLEKIYCNGTTTASNGTFYRNTSVEKLYFPKLDTITYGSGASSTNQNACKIIFSNCSALTEIHFALANKTAIEATAGYATKWGATNATIYFDL